MIDQNFGSRLGDDGVLVATIDMPGRSMNVFSLDLMDSLERLVIRAERDDAVRAVVIASGKDAFLAGADLQMVRMFTERAESATHAELVELCGRLGRIFRRLERCPKPFVAAIDGLALGGGLELALACHARVVSDRRGVLFGLPEIKLGLLPGAGGTQRLPRMVGARRGLDMLLRGYPVKAEAALQCGLVDEIVPSVVLIERARRRTAEMSTVLKPWDRPGAAFDSGELSFDRAGAHDRIVGLLGLDAVQIASYPAYAAIMDCVAEGWSKPMDEALDKEMDIFVRLIRDPVAGNMVRALFVDRQRSLKGLEAQAGRPAACIAVVGDDPTEVGNALTAARAAAVVAPDRLSRDDVVLLTSGAGQVSTDAARVEVLCSGRPVVGQGGPCCAGVWVGEATEHGRAVEVVWSGEPRERDAALVVARALRPDALLLTEGRSSILAELDRVRQRAAVHQLTATQQTLAVALAAARARREGAIADVALADSAAVVAGLVPAYSGGPFRYLQQADPESLRQHIDAARQVAPELFDRSETNFVTA